MPRLFGNTPLTARASKCLPKLHTAPNFHPSLPPPDCAPLYVSIARNHQRTTVGGGNWQVALGYVLDKCELQVRFNWCLGITGARDLFVALCVVVVVLTCAFNKGVSPSMPTSAPNYGHVPVDMALKKTSRPSCLDVPPCRETPGVRLPGAPGTASQKQHTTESESAIRAHKAVSATNAHAAGPRGPSPPSRRKRVKSSRSRID